MPPRGGGNFGNARGSQHSFQQFTSANQVGVSRALTTEKQGFGNTGNNFVGQTIIDKSTEMSYEMRGTDYLAA